MYGVDKRKSERAILAGCLCEGPIAAITNYHKLSALKQHKFIMQFWRSEVLNRWVLLG